jgi:uncharacterized protein (DUF305 family)
MKTTYVISVAAVAALVGFGIGGWYKPMAALAEDTMVGHDMAGMSPWAQAYDDANAAMHAGMMIAYTDNPDLDFANSMIAHHQGAIAMAKIELEHGKDPEIRKLAEDVVAAQTAEIAQMKAWIAKQ